MFNSANNEFARVKKTSQTIKEKFDTIITKFKAVLENQEKIDSNISKITKDYKNLIIGQSQVLEQIFSKEELNIKFIEKFIEKTFENSLALSNINDKNSAEYFMQFYLGLGYFLNAKNESAKEYIKEIDVKYLENLEHLYGIENVVLKKLEENVKIKLKQYLKIEDDDNLHTFFCCYLETMIINRTLVCFKSNINKLSKETAIENLKYHLSECYEFDRFCEFLIPKNSYDSEENTQDFFGQKKNNKNNSISNLETNDTLYNIDYQKTQGEINNNKLNTPEFSTIEGEISPEDNNTSTGTLDLSEQDNNLITILHSYNKDNKIRPYKSFISVFEEKNNKKLCQLKSQSFVKTDTSMNQCNFNCLAKEKNSHIAYPLELENRHITYPLEMENRISVNNNTNNDPINTPKNTIKPLSFCEKIFNIFTIRCTGNLDEHNNVTDSDI